MEDTFSTPEQVIELSTRPDISGIRPDKPKEVVLRYEQDGRPVVSLLTLTEIKLLPSDEQPGLKLYSALGTFVTGEVVICSFRFDDSAFTQSVTIVPVTPEL